MKHLILLLIIITSLSACKKKYNCQCVTTFFYNGGQASYLSKTMVMDKKMNEHQAKAVCDNETENLNQTYSNISTNNGIYSAGSTYSRSDCTISN